MDRAHSWDTHWPQAREEKSEKDDCRKAPESWKDEGAIE